MKKFPRTKPYQATEEAGLAAFGSVYLSWLHSANCYFVTKIIVAKTSLPLCNEVLPFQNESEILQ
jgi:hypothetical protein